MSMPSRKGYKQCPNCSREYSESEKKHSQYLFKTESSEDSVDLLEVDCKDCVYSQKYVTCPECGEISFSLHPHQVEVTRGECLECGFDQRGGFKTK